MESLLPVAIDINPAAQPKPSQPSQPSQQPLRPLLGGSSIPAHVNTKWSRALEDNICAIGEKSFGYRLMHLENARRTKRTYTVLMYLALSLGPVAGLLTGIGVSLDPDTDTLFPILAGSVSFLSGLLMAILKYGKFEEASQSHRQSAAHYNSLESNIRRQMAIPRLQRPDVVPYLEWVGQSFDELLNSAPLIERRIFKSYVKTARVSNMTLPDEYAAEREKIRAVGEDNESTAPRKAPARAMSNVASGNRRHPHPHTYPDSYKYSVAKMQYELHRLNNDDDRGLE